MADDKKKIGQWIEPLEDWALDGEIKWPATYLLPRKLKLPEHWHPQTVFDDHWQALAPEYRAGFNHALLYLMFWNDVPGYKSIARHLLDNFPSTVEFPRAMQSMRLADWVLFKKRYLNE